MMTPRDLPISRKLTWMSMSASAAAVLLACAGFLAYDLATFRAALVRVVSVRAQIVGSNCVSALVFKDPHAAETTLAALAADPHTLAAGIYTPDGKTFASYWRDAKPGRLPPLGIAAGESERFSFNNRELLLFHQIVFEGKGIGTVYVESDLKEMQDRIERYIVITFMVLSVSLLAALLVSSKLRRAIAQPILHLVETARVVSREKDYSVRALSTGNRDELTLLIETFNEMLSVIQERDAALEKARSELERRVEERTAELQATNKELEAFTYSVSHDLRAPLRHIDGFSKLLVEDFGRELSEDARRYLTRVREGARQMGQLVDDLLNLARVGRRELNVQLTGLDNLVAEVLADLKSETTTRKIDWKLARLPFVECDAALMKQVFANLLSNAVKYTRPRDRALIEVGVRTENGQPAVFVRDNGVGFSMKYANKLFGVFQRLHRPEDFEGTGVGLATVQRIIHKHGGRVWADAEIDRGATFYFTLGGLEAFHKEELAA